MTPLDVERYLETIGKDLQLQLCKTIPDDDIYQQASLDLLRDCGQYHCPTDKDFTKLFCRYFLTIRSRQRYNAHCEGVIHKHYSLEEYRDSMGSYQLNHYANDPREDIRTEVMDYIGLLPMAYRPVFVLVFIEGMTYEEAGAQAGISTMGVHKLVQDGVQWIRDELEAIG